MAIAAKDVGTAAGPRVLVTGFGPFPGAPDNPTLGVLRDLEADGMAGVALQTVRLPVTFGGIATALREAAARFAPESLLMLGLAVRRDMLSIETLARNHAGHRVPDTDGAMPEAAQLVAGAPATLAATWPAADVLAALGDAGHAARLSDDAGDYVCNAALFHALHEVHAGTIGFLHVPALGIGGTTPASLTSATRVAIRTLVSRRPAPDGAPPEPDRRR